MMYLIRWNLFTKPPNQSGLGIGGSKIKNKIAILAKFGWPEPNSLWHQVISSILKTKTHGHRCTAYRTDLLK